jgi:hypothetical protein
MPVSVSRTYTGLQGWNVYKNVSDAVVIMHSKLSPVSLVRAPGLPLCLCGTFFCTYPTSQKVVGLITNEVISFFKCPKPSSCTMTLG